jgi:hypothetical protein
LLFSSRAQSCWSSRSQTRLLPDGDLVAPAFALVAFMVSVFEVPPSVVALRVGEVQTGIVGLVGAAGAVADGVIGELPRGWRPAPTTLTITGDILTPDTARPTTARPMAIATIGETVTPSRAPSGCRSTS